MPKLTNSDRQNSRAISTSASELHNTSHIKLGLYSITYLGVWYRGGALTLEEVIQRAKRFGYEGIEIDGKRPHGNPLDMSSARCEQLRRYAGDHGIEIYAVAANNDFSSPIPEHFESQLLYTRELIAMTQRLGAKLVRVFVAWPGVTVLPEGGATYDFAKAAWRHVHQSFTQEQIWERCREGLVESARYAQEQGITLALQNHPPLITSYRDCLRMVREVASPNLKICFDGRLEKQLTDSEVERAALEVGPLQVLSHFGGEYDERPDGITITPGEKCAAEVRALVGMGYSGYIGYELCHPLPHVDGRPPGIDFVDKNARLAATYMRKLIEQARCHAASVSLTQNAI